MDCCCISPIFTFSILTEQPLAVKEVPSSAGEHWNRQKKNKKDKVSLYLKMSLMSNACTSQWIVDRFRVERTLVQHEDLECAASKTYALHVRTRTVCCRVLNCIAMDVIDLFRTWRYCSCNYIWWWCQRTQSYLILSSHKSTWNKSKLTAVKSVATSC